jgi:hypothetical protein
VACLLVCGAARGQSGPSDQEAAPGPRGVWKAEMPAGNYLVKLGAISSVSRHEYLVDGVGRVSEVNLSAQGPALARFYFVEPNVPQLPGGVGQSTVNFLEEKMREGVSRAGADDLWRTVIKSYPVATHAHTVEYRLQTREALDKLFGSIERAFTTGRGETFKP